MLNTNIRNYLAFGLLLFMLCGVTAMGLADTAYAQERGRQHREFMDSRHNHNHSYPARGQYIGHLPQGNRVVIHRGSRYYSYGGVWYRPEGRRFFIVGPPIGLFVPFLPAFYTTFWIHGIPYYYANEVYYTPTAGGYVVTESPQDDISTTPPSADQTAPSQMFIYPRRGQSEKQQASDRYDCHSWAVSQTNYDPTKPPADTPANQLMQKRADYQRAMGACLEGRGYTTK